MDKNRAINKMDNKELKLVHQVYISFKFYCVFKIVSTIININKIFII